MPEIERDDFERDAGLQQCHGATIAKAMGGDAAALEGRALRRRLFHGQIEAAGDTVMAQRSTPAVGEDQMVGCDFVRCAPPP